MNTIYFSHFRLLITSKVLAALTLALQSALVLSAGLMLHRGAPMAVDESRAILPSCHDARPNLDPLRKLCKAHCLTEAQSFDHAEIPLDQAPA
ncbi:MAG: hypothetical protein ABIP64_18785 [Burkholderiales bacterium]